MNHQIRNNFRHNEFSWSLKPPVKRTNKNDDAGFIAHKSNSFIANYC